ncbi:MAG: hypothetical protein M1819_006752 [Sarea resinae]|nr:MAG: hypothetical protein M1819_006752 [Sarea resinae]
MGWFSSSSPSVSPPVPKPSSDGAFEAPGRNERAHCWEARDAFFKCLDSNSIIDSIKDHGLAGERCAEEGKAFEKNCASSWVQYFKKRRVMEYNKNQTLEKLKAEGARPLPGGGGGPDSLPSRPQ